MLEFDYIKGLQNFSVFEIEITGNTENIAGHKYCNWALRTLVHPTYYLQLQRGVQLLKGIQNSC